MEMVLTPIITVVAVVIILIIARAMDKNNRSIDHVRKYVKKSMDDIDQYVRTKQEILKQSSIDFESNKIAMNSLQHDFEEIEKGLNDKYAAMGGLFNQVETYQNAVTNIDNQINEIDEKIDMLKVEDTFLNNLTKQIHASKQKMDEIDSQMAKTFKNFEDKNAAQIEDLWVSAVQEANHLKDELFDQVDNIRTMVNDFQDHIDSLEATRDRMEDELVQSADGQLKDLLNRRVSEFDHVSEEMQSELQTYLDKYQEEVKDYGKQTEELKSDYALSLEKNAAILRKHLQASENVLKNLDVKTEGLTERAESVESLVLQIRGYDPEIEKLSTLQQNIEKNLSDLKQGQIFIESANKRIGTMRDAFDKLQTKLSSLETDLVEKNQQSLEALAEGVKGSVETTSKSFLAQFEVVQEQLSDFENRMQVLDDERTRFFVDAEQQFNDTMDVHLRKAKNESKELFDSVQGDLAKASGSLTAEFQNRLDYMRQEYASLEGNVKELLNSVDKVKSDSVMEINQAHEKTHSEIDIELATFKQEMEQTLANLKQKLEGEEGSFREFYNQYSITFKDEQLAAESASSKITHLLNELGDKSDQVEQLASRLANYDEQMDRLSRMSLEATEKLNFIEGRKNLITKLEGKVRQSEKALSSIEGRIPQIQDQISAANEEKLQEIYLKQQAKEKDYAASLMQRINEASANVSDFEVKIGFLQNRRDKLGESIINQIEEKSSQLAQQFEQSLSKQMTEKSGLALTELQNQVREIVQAYNKEVTDLENEAKNISQNAVLTTGRLTASVKDECDKISTQLQTLTTNYKADVQKHTEMYRTQELSSSRMKTETEQLLSQLSEREGNINQIYERLEEVDVRMKEIVRLSDETHNNFQEVQKHSRFIQGLVKSASAGETKLNQIEKRIPEMEKRFADENQGQLEAILSQFTAQTDERMAAVENQLNGTHDQLDSFNKEMTQFFEQKRSEEATSLNQFKKDLSEIRLSAEEEQKAVVATCEENINEYLSQFKNSTGEIFTKTTNLIQMLKTSYSENEGSWDERVKQFRDETAAIETNFKTNMENMMSKVQEMDDVVFGKLKVEVAKAGEEARQEMMTRLDAVKEQVLKIEAQALDFEYEVNSRYDALEDLPKQLDQVENSLKGYMKVETQKIREDFNQFSSDLNAMEAQERKKIEDVSANFDNTMKEIEASVHELKKEAHENLSGKLLSVEGEFTKDLDERKQLLQRQIEEFRNQLDQEMANANAVMNQRRESLEAELRAAFTEAANKNKASCLAELQGINDHIATFKEEVAGSFETTKAEFDKTKQNISLECEALKENASKIIESQLQLYNDKFKGDLANSRTEFMQELDKIRATIGENNSQVDLMLINSRNNIDLWQETQLEQWTQHQQELDKQVGDFRENIEKDIENFKGAFKGRQDEFENEYTQKVIVVNGKIDTLGQAVENFSNTLNSSKLTFEKEVKDNKNALLANTEEVRKEILEAQGGLENRISSAVNILESEFEAINRQIQDFKKQTQLFERADSLKQKLKDEMQIITDMIAQMKEEKKELKATDKDFENVRKLEADLTNRLSMMKNQRAYLENLDDKFTRLLGISDDVDNRLKTLSTSNEKLQAMEMQARRLTDLESDLGEKYQHLDNQQKMLEETNKGVGMAFGELNKIEDRMKAANSDLVKFLKSLKESNERIQLLMNGKADADKATKLLIDFDEKLSRLEKHLEEVRESEEWFAGTETRIKNYSDKMDENLKIFATLNGVKNSGSNHSISQSDKKAMIVKFAKEGWTVEQIQNATGISRGEIELTLQMVSKTK